jgi:hypothetical protein
MSRLSWPEAMPFMKVSNKQGGVMTNEPQVMWEMIEDCDSNSDIYRAYLDHCWNHYRPHMRIMAESFCKADGAKFFREYVESFNTLQDRVMGDI